MYRPILLGTIFFLAQAADDGSDLLSKNLMMQRLREAEEKSQFSGEGEFVYKEKYEGSVVDDPLPEDLRNRWFQFPLVGIRGFMREQDALQEVDYFREVAASKLLSDEQKVSEPLVCTHYFEQLSRKEQQEKDNALRQLLGRLPDPDYPVGRLLFAALLYAKAEVNNRRGGKLLETIVLKDDISLTKIALQNVDHPSHRKRRQGVAGSQVDRIVGQYQ